MKSKRFITLSFLIGILLFGMILTGGCLKRNSTTTTPTTTLPPISTPEPNETSTPTSTPEPAMPPGVPPEYREEYKKMIAKFDEKIAEWTPTTYEPMMFGAALGALPKADKPEGKQYIQASYNMFFDELELDFTTLYLPYAAYLNNDVEKIKVYDDIIQQMRDNGKKIVITDSEFNGINTDITWEKFKELHLEWIRIITERYHPDYFFVIEDPWFPWYPDQTFISDRNSVTPQMVVEHTRESSDLVKSIDPRVKTGIGLSSSSSENNYILFKGAMDIPTLDVFGEFAFALDDLEKYEKDIEYAQSKGKEVWLLDISLGAYITPRLDNYWQAPFDAKYLQASVYWGQNHNIEGYSWMFSRLFFTYNAKLTKEDASKRTILYEKYLAIVNEVRGK